MRRSHITQPRRTGPSLEEGGKPRLAGGVGPAPQDAHRLGRRRSGRGPPPRRPGKAQEFVGLAAGGHRLLLPPGRVRQYHRATRPHQLLTGRVGLRAWCPSASLVNIGWFRCRW